MIREILEPVFQTSDNYTGVNPGFSVAEGVQRQSIKLPNFPKKPVESRKCNM